MKLNSGFSLTQWGEMNILFIILAVGLSGCASVMKQYPIKLEDECLKPSNSNKPMCKFLSSGNIADDSINASSMIDEMLIDFANEDKKTSRIKAAIAIKGLRRWRSKAMMLQDELDAYAKGCQ